jgi:hypothetical protein
MKSSRTRLLRVCASLWGVRVSKSVVLIACVYMWLNVCVLREAFHVEGRLLLLLLLLPCCV